MAFTPSFIDFLISIGQQIGVAIENAQLYAEVKSFSQELE